jgi:hypothetical protein
MADARLSYIRFEQETRNGKRAPVQTSGERTVAWEVSAEAWKEYAAEGHGDQSHERLCQRGGFGVSELADLLYLRIKRLERASPRPAPSDSKETDHG